MTTKPKNSIQINKIASSKRFIATKTFTINPNRHRSVKKKSLDSESMRQSFIIKFLMSVPDSRVIRLYNCPPFNKESGKYVRHATGLTPKGLPDLLFLSKKYGVHFFEVKSVREYATLQGKMYKIRAGRCLKSYLHVANQIHFHDEINSFGVAKCHFVCCVEHVKQALGLPFEIPKIEG